MPFTNDNVLNKLSPTDNFQVGKTNVDDGAILERGINLSTPGKSATWIYFDCTVGCMLDSGIVVHNRLPQIDNTADTLASSLLDDTNLDRVAGPGVNLRCNDQYADIVQRMGHSRYWFRIWGQALRFRHRIPIPGIRYIGGVPAIPYDRNPQWAFCRIFPGGNYGGVILWHAAWSLWYTTAVPPKSNQIPEADPSAHIRGDVQQPASIQAPYSQPDDNAVKAAPAQFIGLGGDNQFIGPVGARRR